MRRSLTLFFTAIVMAVKSVAITPDQFRAHADTVIDRFAAFDPVWATNMGIHKYDSLLADYSPKNVAGFISYLKAEKSIIGDIDTSGWPIDDIIDYRLLMSNIKNQILQLETFPYWKKSPGIYADQCISGIYFLVLRDFAPLDQKLPSFLGRLKRIPTLCRTAKRNLTDPVPIFIESAIEAIDEGIVLIESACNTFSKRFPRRAEEIDSARGKAVMSMRELNSFCMSLKAKARGNYAIGKKSMEFLLSDIDYLEFDIDSLISLGENTYAWADSAMRAIEPSLPPPDTSAHYPLKNLGKEDVLDYYQWEIDQMKEYSIQAGIATLPENFGKCIPMETPAFLRGIIRGIAYEPPAPLDSFQNGFFYVRPFPDTFTAKNRADYGNYICRRGFKGSVVHEGYPGHHMQLQLANRNTSIIRKIQQNLIFVEGWALYCEEMVYHQGLFGDDTRQWHGILGGIRFRAVRIIVDIGLQTGRFTPITALEFMNEKLGENPYYYTGEIRRYCAYPGSALSYLTGKTLISQMRQNAALQEGERFDLRRFHDKLLSEGSISPTLIAEKYGW